MKIEKSTLLARYPELAPLSADLDEAEELMASCFAAGGKVLLCGNGGSAADCEHIAGELLKGFLSKRPLAADRRKAFSGSAGSETGGYIADRLQGGFPAVPLSSLVSAGTAFANDVAPDLAFAQLVYALGKTGDLLIALSTSGNSANIVNAALTARTIGMRVVAFTGADGGRLAGIADTLLNVPSRDTYRAQEFHLPVYHYLCARIEERFYGE